MSDLIEPTPEFASEIVVANSGVLGAAAPSDNNAQQLIDSEGSGVLQSITESEKLTGDIQSAEFDPEITQEFDTSIVAALDFLLGRSADEAPGTKDRLTITRPEPVSKPHVDVDFAEVFNDTQGSGLSAEQKRLLELYADVSDAQTFNETVGLYAGESEGHSTLVSDMHQVERSEEEQKTEFYSVDSRLEETSSSGGAYSKKFLPSVGLDTSFQDASLDLLSKELTEVREVKPATAASLDEKIDGAIESSINKTVSPFDFACLGAVNYSPRVTGQMKKPGGLSAQGGLTAVVEKVTTQTDWVAKLSNPKIIAAAVLVLLWVTLGIAPNLVRASSRDEDVTASKQMRSNVRDQLKDETPYYVQKPSEMPRGSSSGTGAGGTSNTSSSSTSATANSGENVTIAPGSSIQVLESQLADNPDADQVRAELVRRLIAKGQRQRARILAVLGFKRPGVSAQMRAQFWQLFKETQ